MIARRNFKQCCYMIGLLLCHVINIIICEVLVRHACGDGEFYCSEERKCIQSAYRCDYRPDCLFGEDERNCGSCDFSKDTCGYVDQTRSRRVFKRFQPPKNDKLLFIPPVDHTTGLNKGFFMLTYPTRHLHNSTIMRECSPTSPCSTDESLYILVSPFLAQTSPRCHIAFSYYYYTKSSGGLLEVGHLQPNDMGIVESVVWKEELDAEARWRQGKVEVGQRERGWSLFFRTDQKYVALDDITFEGCSYSRPKSGGCQGNQVQCVDGSCINSTQLCDFANDCIDGSDENAETCKRYSERCNFEEDFCHWQPGYNGDFRWLRRNEASKPPFIDHSLETSQGYYAVVDASEHDGNKTASLVSVAFKKGRKRCTMKLYFYIDKGFGHELYVKRRTVKDGVVWRSALSGQTEIGPWTRAEINLTTEVNFQVVIEAKTGHTRDGVIAIDDISFGAECVADKPACKDKEFSCGDGECIPCEQNYCVCNFVKDCGNNADEKNCPASCDFEESTCGWQNENPEESHLMWEIHQGLAPDNKTGPHYDHTKKTILGHYMYVDAQHRVRSNFPKAYFLSPLFHHGAYHCNLSFWYNMYHDEVADKNDAILSVIYRSRDKQGNVSDSKVWVDSNTTGIKWREGTASLPHCPRDFNIIFEVDHYWNTHTDVSIDDWKFHCSEPPSTSCDKHTKFTCSISKQCISLDSICDLDKNCCDGSDESEEACEGYSTIDFEEGFTNGWVQLNTPRFDFLFTRQQGIPSMDNALPIYDHTTQEAHGTYICTKLGSSGSRIQNQTAAIASPTIGATIDIDSATAGATTNLGTNTNYTSSTCEVRFWYNMYAAGMGTLSVSIATTFGIAERKLWSTSGNQGKVWKKQSVKVYSEHDFQIIFEATIGTDVGFGDLGLDDITLTPGCNLTGRTLKGGPTPSPQNRCFPNFSCKSKYNVDQVECVPQYDVCDFEKDCPEGDDESEGVCGYPQSFEHGFGAWYNSPDFPLHFVIHKGPTPTPNTGPMTDATGNATGHYIYFDTRKPARQDNIIAQLESPWYQSSYSECKLHFFYHMYGERIGSLKVQLNDREGTTDMFEMRDNVGNHWNEINISISRRREPFRILFRTHGKAHRQGGGLSPSYYDTGDIAIDEIDLLDCQHPPVCGEAVAHDQFKCTNNNCVPKGKVCDYIDDCGDSSDEDLSLCSNYMGCAFDNDPRFCNLKQEKISDDFDWTMHRGQTDSVNTGPTHDHTFKTFKGNYIYIEASDRKMGEKARLQSFPISSSPAEKCELIFHYHRFGRGLGKLNVNLLRSGYRTLKEQFDSPSEFMWKRAVIDLSNETDFFQVEFEGTIGTSHEGDIALDDIIFTPGCLTLPNSTRVSFPFIPRCAENKFTCKMTGACVPFAAHCNGTQECKDGTDEIGCIFQRITKRPRLTTTQQWMFCSFPVLLIIFSLTSLLMFMKLRRNGKIHYLFSIYDTSANVGTDEHTFKKSKKSKKASTISCVSNPTYENPKEKKLEKGNDYQTKKTTDSPLYQEPFFLSKPNVH